MASIRDIYLKYSIPPNLQKHMLQVASISQAISDHWKGPKLNQPDLILTALLHDLGNLVKFNLDKPVTLLKNKRFWLKKQKDFIKKYGPDDHVATIKILEEIKIPPHIIHWIKIKTFANIRNLVSSSAEWEAKILLYSDLRVLPHGINSLEERIKDIKARMPHYFNRPDFQQMISAAFRLEKLIQDQTEINLNKIQDYLPSFNKFLSQKINRDIINYDLPT